MKSYTVKYRQPGQWFWRKVKNVTGDGVEAGFRFLSLADDSLLYLSLNAEVHFPPARQALILAKMSAEAGQQLVRSL